VSLFNAKILEIWLVYILDVYHQYGQDKITSTKHFFAGHLDYRVMALCLVFIRCLFQILAFFFFWFSNFFNLTITEETSVVEMCIWCIKIVNELVLHFCILDMQFSVVLLTKPDINLRVELNLCIFLEKKEHLDHVLFSKSGKGLDDRITKCIGATTYQSTSYIRG
jgi:hypothetical protein